MRNLFLLYWELFTFAATFIAAVALCFTVCYKDGIAAVAHAKRGLILSHHKAEHHLQTNQQRVEIPDDGGFVQQCDPVGRRNAAECRNTLCHKPLFVRIKSIAMLIEILAGREMLDPSAPWRSIPAAQRIPFGSSYS